MLLKDYEYWINPILKDLRFIFIQFIEINTKYDRRYLKIIDEFIIQVNYGLARNGEQKKSNFFQFDLSELIRLVIQLLIKGLSIQKDIPKITLTYLHELLSIRNDDAHFKGWNESTVLRYLDTILRVTKNIDLGLIDITRIYYKIDDLEKRIYLEKHRGEVSMNNSENIQLEKDGENLNESENDISNSKDQFNEQILIKNDDLDQNKHINENKKNQPSLIELIEKIKIEYIDNSKIQYQHGTNIRDYEFQYWIDKMIGLANAMELDKKNYEIDKDENYQQRIIDNIKMFLNTYQTVKNRLFLKKIPIYGSLNKKILANLNQFQKSLVVYDNFNLDLFDYLWKSSDYEIADFIDTTSFDDNTEKIFIETNARIKEKITKYIDKFIDLNLRYDSDFDDPDIILDNQKYYNDEVVDLINYIENFYSKINELIPIQRNIFINKYYMLLRPTIICENKIIQKAKILIFNNLDDMKLPGEYSNYMF